MARIKPSSIRPQDRKDALDLLWYSLSSLSGPEETENFLKELLSDSEALMLARRLQIASLLLKGYTCDEIQYRLKAGKNTIVSVSQWLQKTASDKQKLITKLEKNIERGKFKRKLNEKSSSHPFSLKHLKRRYPLHFLLLHIADEVSFEREYKKTLKNKK